MKRNTLHACVWLCLCLAGAIGFPARAQVPTVELDLSNRAFLGALPFNEAFYAKGAVPAGVHRVEVRYGLKTPNEDQFLKDTKVHSGYWTRQPMVETKTFRTVS